MSPPPAAGSPAFRDDLVGAEPYGAPQLDVEVRLNTNENPFGPDADLVAAIADAVAGVAAGLNRYPDRDARALRADLADYLAEDTGVPLDADRVWAANGSNEVMHHLFTLFGGPGRRALVFDPTYSMYPQYARDTSTALVSRPRGEGFALDRESVEAALAETVPDLVVLDSPNNPTGRAVDPALIEAVCARAPGVVIVDEAYAEFRRPGTPSAVGLLETHANLVVTRTMSKAFALAGARVGYAAASPAIVDGLRLVRLPYHLSTVTQAVARTALQHRSGLLSKVAALREERDAQVAWLRAHGFEVVESDANFVLVGRFADRSRAWQALVAAGVLVREVGPPGWLRVTIGTPEDNARFRGALPAAASASGMIDPGSGG